MRCFLKLNELVINNIVRGDSWLREVIIRKKFPCVAITAKKEHVLSVRDNLTWYDYEQLYFPIGE